MSENNGQNNGQNTQQQDTQNIINNYAAEQSNENTDNTQQNRQTQQNSTDNYSQQGYVPPRDFKKVGSALNSYEKQPVRRVGTITLGLTLIALGTVAIAFMINPNLDYITIAKLTPIIFVFLGLEILINYFLGKGHQMKYDFLSGFVCFMLLFGSLGVVASVPVLKHIGPIKGQVESRLSGEIYDTLYQQLSGNKNIKSIDVDVNLGYLSNTNDITAKDLKKGNSHVFIDIELLKEYQNDSDFAADCKSIIDVIKSNNLDFSRITISSDGKNNHHSITISDKFQLNLDLSDLNKLIEKDNEEDVTAA